MFAPVKEAEVQVKDAVEQATDLVEQLFENAGLVTVQAPVDVAVPSEAARPKNATVSEYATFYKRA